MIFIGLGLLYMHEHNNLQYYMSVSKECYGVYNGHSFVIFLYCQYLHLMFLLQF